MLGRKLGHQFHVDDTSSVRVLAAIGDREQLEIATQSKLGAVPVPRRSQSKLPSGMRSITRRVLTHNITS